MVDPSPEDQQLLVELLAGDRSPDEPAVAARLARDPAFRAEFESLRAMEQRVEAVAHRERTLVAAALMAGSGAGSGASTAVPGPKVLPPVRRGPGRSAWAVGALAACAAAVALYVAFREPGPQRNDDERPLGVAGLVLREPPPLAAGPLLLRWDVGAGLRGAQFAVTILDPARKFGKPLHTRPDELADRTEWNVPPEIQQTLRPGLIWRVETRAGGVPVVAERPLR